MPDQHATRPQAKMLFVEFFCLEICQFKVAPVMQAWPFGAVTGR
jgi:hypothetical protein